MADQLLSTRIINNATPFTTYVVGDKIETFYDDTNDVFVVKKNDVTITSGDSFATASLVNGDYSFTKTGYSFCDGTTLVDFATRNVQSFPYAVKRVTADSPTCSTTVPDLEKVSISVTPASNRTTNDGLVILKASSSNGPVKFAPVVQTTGTPFDYETSGIVGTQSGSIYTATLDTIYAGTYNFAAIDAVGAVVFWLDVTVGVDESLNYGTKYTFDYDHRIHTDPLTFSERRVLIKKRDYSGSTTTVTGAGSPVEIGWGLEGKTDKGTVILGGWMKISFMFTSKFQYTSEFAQISEKEWLIELYDKPTGANTLIQKGYLIPGNYSEPFKGGNYAVTLTATDGLADLKEKDYLTDEIEIIGGLNPFSQLAGKSLSGSASIKDILAFCLQKTKTGNSLRLGMNTFEASHDSASGANGGNETGDAADDPLDQTYINQSSYYENGLPLDCFTVLERILGSLPEICVLMSVSGYFYLIPLKNNGASLAYREYDSGGTYSSNSTIAPIIDIGQYDDTSRFVYSQDSATLTFREVFSKIRITENRSIVDNLVNDFNRLTRKESGDGYKGWVNINNTDSGTWKAFKPVGTQKVRNQALDFLDFSGKPTYILDNNLGYRLQFLFNDGQGGNAYVTASDTIEYKVLDTFVIDIEYYFAPIVYNRLPPYVPLRWSLQVGTKYYNANNTWTSGAEVINQYYSTDFNKAATFSIEGFFDTSVTTNTSETFILRVYDMDTYLFDEESTSKANMITDIQGISTTNLNPGSRIITRYDGATGGNYTAFYYELRGDDATADSIRIITPSDNSNYRWYLVHQFQQPAPTGLSDPSQHSTFYLNRVKFKSFPEGVDIEDRYVFERVISNDNLNVLDYGIHHFDLDHTLNNTERLVRNYFKLSNGTATSQWGSDEKKAQDLLADELVRHYKNPAKIVTLTGYSDLEVKPWNVIRDTNDDNRIYKFNRLSIDDKYGTINAELEAISDDTVAAGSTTGEFVANEFKANEFVI